MSITIRGLDALYRKLGAAAATKHLEPPMQRGLYRLQRTMQEYPPPPSGSKYVRSGTYGRRWAVPPKITSSGKGLFGRIGNNVGYAPFVGSRMFQARIHQRRWNTDAEAVAQNEAAITADFASAVDRALAS